MHPLIEFAPLKGEMHPLGIFYQNMRGFTKILKRTGTSQLVMIAGLFRLTVQQALP